MKCMNLEGSPRDRRCTLETVSAEQRELSEDRLAHGADEPGKKRLLLALMTL